MDAGWDVVGVDTNASRLRDYPGETVRADAIEYLTERGGFFDAIHASPPCQAYSIATAGAAARERHPRLIAAVRAELVRVGRPYVIENVVGARSELTEPFLLCWTMFHEPGSIQDEDGTPLQMYRHRLFEAGGWDPGEVPRCRHARGVQVAGAYGGGRSDRHEARYVRRGGYTPSASVRRELVGTGWMTQAATNEAIPPPYTKWVGERLWRHVDRCS